MASKFSRRDLLKGSSALIAGTVFAEPVRAAAPPAEAITPALIEAAKKEGKCAFYTAMDLTLAERLGKAFEAKYGIAVRVERSGAERIFTAHRPGASAARSSPSTWSTRRTRRIASSGSATAGSRAYLPEEVAKALRQALLRRRTAST